MNKTLNRESILAEIKRRQEAKKLQEAKAKPSRKILESVARSKQTKVVSETRRATQPKTLAESVQARLKGFSEEKRLAYTTLTENIANAVRSIYSEATQAGTGVYGVEGNGAGVGLVKTYFDIFFGYFPNLIVPEIASMQPIKTERAMIFYYETVAGSDKGNVKKGDKLITPFEVNTDPEYTSDVVTVKEGVATPIWGPVVARSVRLEENGKELEVTYSTDTAFTATSSAGAVTGTITIANDQITVDLTGAGAGAVTKITYAYGNKYAPTQVPELNANVASRDIVAKARTVKTNYSFQAGFGFEAQFGAKLEDKLAEAAMYELKRETDLDFVFEIMKAAPTKVVWNKAAGVANGLYEFHKLSFVDAIAQASNHIFRISKRKAGNVLLVGINAQTIVQTLPQFKGDTYGMTLDGAKVIGKLGEMKVIAVPELGENDWAVIYRSETDNLDAGIVFAPYIPVVATPTVMLDDLLARKAYTTSYGKLVVNPNYFVRGEIINNPIAQPMFLVSKDGTDTDLGELGVDAFLA